MADASYFNMAKEWVPRSHLVGAYGTMSRQVGGRAKIFTQYIEEEAEDVAAMAGRPEVEGSYVEVAFIQCKDSRDGKAVVEVLHQFLDDGAAGEAFHALYEVTPGDAGPQNPSVHILVSVGSTAGYVDQLKSRDEDDKMKLSSRLKTYNSIVFCNASTDAMKEEVEKLNKGKKFNVDIAESHNYRIPEGYNAVLRYCKNVGDKLVVRVEELGFADAAGQSKYMEALGVLFSSDHRLTDTPAYRARKTPGMSAELTSVISFTLKKSETEYMTLTFDDADIMAQDTEVESSSGEVKEGYEAISMANLYYLGGGAHEIVNHRIGANKQRNFFASAPKVVFGDHYAQ